ncbi:hypothetical protein SDRG_00598 [Saprolegnia diclina VS20]|uniref:Uncharacterized protein n=1 Tax=Saprolegnia diclina (strain VS20) TaxID=1156394 RepID=T0R8S2_SAPDV|nr:hypothetical protein SDRG_00598 [Saprolegnia diclina VS20]EQC42880.1 hypothetical protein SDRG_00598 [Saprolegnia diclina VS20]|eukprot:XP_008604303.1 hypothetical protein SDRG_00598 [Saprolegnia diclina VS20]
MDADSVSFSFEGLGRVDKALVGVLAATGGYDVTLVGFKTYRDVYDSDDADEYDWTSDAALYENEIIRIPFRESGSALDVVVPGLLDQSAHHFLGRKRVDDDYGLKCPMAAILFWPKRFRVTIARPSGVVSLLKAAIEDGKLDDLGLGLHDFVLGALTTFDDNTSTALDADAMGRLLLQYKDVELVKRFLRDTLPLSISDKTNTARCIYESLDTFGWPTLLPSIQSLLARAAKDFGGFSAICPLLASLAGLPSERDAVCPPLRQPYTGEFLKACWQAAVLEPAFRPGAHPTQYSILLDWYFDAVLPARPNDNYLGKWLPAPLLLLVDSFAYTRVVGSHSALSAALPPWDQLRYLPRALLAATQCQPSLPRAPYITAVTTAMSLKAMRGSLSAHETATLLQYLDVVGCVDANLVAMCPALSGGIGNFLWGVLEFVKRAPPPAATAALMMRFLLDLAPTVPCTRRDYSGNNVPMIDALADLISALAMLSPEAALQCAAAWRSGLPPTLDAVRDILYPLVEKLQRQESDVRFRELLAYLATECRATLVDGGALAPLPAFKDYAIADAIDMDATHCDQCVAFVRFLCTGNATAMIYCNSDCSKIKAVVARHPHRLILTRQDNGYSSYLELRKQTWPGMASADDAAAHLRREDERRQDEQRVKKLTALLADLAPKVSGSKRRMEDA